MELGFNNHVFSSLMQFLFLGKLVTIRGTVVRVGNVKPLVTHLAFNCTACKTQQVYFCQTTV